LPVRLGVGLVAFETKIDITFYPSLFLRPSLNVVSHWVIPSIVHGPE
jgi:hypothetical protein